MPLAYPPFQPADRSEFQTKYRNFGPLANREDLKLWETLNNDAAFSHMRSATICWGFPAVAGITFLLAPILDSVDESGHNYIKKGAGAMVCSIMEANGFEKTDEKKAVPPSPYRIFKKAEVYRLLPTERN